MRVVSVEFIEVVPAPHTSQDILSRIYPDDKGKAFELTYDGKRGILIIQNKANRELTRCVPLSNIRHFQVAAEDVPALLAQPVAIKLPDKAK